MNKYYAVCCFMTSPTTVTPPTATATVTAPQAAPQPPTPQVDWREAYGNAALVNVAEAAVPFQSTANYSHALADDGAFFAASPARDDRQQALQQKQFLADGLLHANLCGADVSDFLVAPAAGSTAAPRLLVDIILDESQGEAAQHKTIIALMNKTYYDENTVFHVDKKVNDLVHEVLLKVSSEVKSIDTAQVRHDYAHKSQPSCPLSLADSVKPLVSGVPADALVDKKIATAGAATGLDAEKFSRAVKSLAGATIPLIVSANFGCEIERVPAVPPATQDSVQRGKLITDGVGGSVVAYLPNGMAGDKIAKDDQPSVLVELTEPQGVRRFVVPLEQFLTVEISGTKVQRTPYADELQYVKKFLEQSYNIKNIIEPPDAITRLIVP